LRGLAAIVFGVVAVIWPGVTLLFLVALFAAYALLSGGAALVGAFRNRGDRGWRLALVLGLVGIAAGVFSGALEIAMAVRLRREIAGQGEWLLGVAGFVSILFGGFVLLFPGPGALALVWLVALHAITIGMLFLFAAFSLRARARTTAGPPRAAHPA
jgi:uncharacterized membrane protein HdeD (DUF308 family)